MILREIIDLKTKLLFLKNEILKINDDSKSSLLKMQELYREYLKLEVRLQPKTPKNNNAYYSISSNCYTYALDLPIPYFLENILNKNPHLKNFLTIQNVGMISGYRKNIKYGITSEKEFLECLYSDLEYLKIKYYDTDILSKQKHNGYKIGIYYDAKITDGLANYHFVRQNIDGSWSSKMGISNELHFSEDIDDFKRYYQNRVNLDLVKTLEIVKPSFR